MFALGIWNLAFLAARSPVEAEVLQSPKVTYGNEAEELLKKQLAIEQEVSFAISGCILCT